MDNNGNGGVYAAEKIIRKRYKKVKLKSTSNHLVDQFNGIGDGIVYVFCITHHIKIFNIGCIVAIFD